ncbi:MAG: hypothetical protein ACREGH_01525 [Minisyncoccia bacterium]
MAVVNAGSAFWYVTQNQTPAVNPTAGLSTRQTTYPYTQVSYSKTTTIKNNLGFTAMAVGTSSASMTIDFITCEGSHLYVDFGDGSHGTTSADGSCHLRGTGIEHTYAANGTYTAKFVGAGDNFSSQLTITVPADASKSKMWWIGPGSPEQQQIDPTTPATQMTTEQTTPQTTQTRQQTNSQSLQNATAQTQSVAQQTSNSAEGTTTITTNSNIYPGFDNPFVVTGTATGYSSLHISIQAPGPGCTPNTCIVSTSTVIVVNGQWSLHMPESDCCTMQNSHTVYIFPPTDQDFEPSDNNPPIAKESFTAHQLFSPTTLTSLELTGNASAADVNSTGLKALDIYIYDFVPIGNNNVKIGQLVYSASSTPMQFSDCTPSPVTGDCVLHWSVPLDASLRSGTGYEIILYVPGHYNVPPLSQSSLGAQ